VHNDEVRRFIERFAPLLAESTVRYLQQAGMIEPAMLRRWRDR
jgi:hypothetical protein